MVFGPVLFAFVFGDVWSEAGQYAQWMALWIIAGLANIPSVKAIPVINEQKRFILFGLTSLIFRIGSIIISYYTGHDGIFAVMISSVSGAVLNFLLIFFVLNGIKNFKLRNTR